MHSLIDTHCHIHESDYPLEIDEVISRAKKTGVDEIICVGTNIDDSKLALELAQKYDNIFASIGVHPHYADVDDNDPKELGELLYSMEHLQPEFNKAPGPLADAARSRSMNKRSRRAPRDIDTKIVAIGEIGLDYHYQDEPSHDEQKELLKRQIELALKHDLPIIFHVREAYDDFWKVLDDFGERSKKIRGVLHSFTDTMENAREGLRRGFYISVNGISTFTHDKSQKEVYVSIPLDRLLLETDAPWLTPYPLRGKVKINQPAYVKEIAEYISKTRNVPIEKIADITTKNAHRLFNIRVKLTKTKQKSR